MSAAAPPREPGAPPANAVAIVGVAGRFPGARDPEQFWRNLLAGVESISRFSDAELEDAFDDAVRGAPNFVRARPILEGVEQFDAEFFGMYAREAELTDPQQRVFLECAWEALENAGCDPRRYRGAIGVFAGCSINTYFLHHVCADRRTLEEFTSSYQVGCYPMLLGAGLDFLATRVSYKLDLRGPSLDLQTACSTSLLAVAQASQSLLLYQSDMALAGGVSISFPQKRGYQHQEGAMVSADGHCRPFDANASGTVFGSGAGVVALKRLDDAIADGDHIYAVIRGCGVNNDGAAKVGFTAPSIEGQAAAIEMALANAGVAAPSIGYVECHGTATPLGDPIEVAALTRAFAGATQGSCALGSVKSNVGHLDAAAGVVGLIKTALALERGVLPASLHFERPNPQIDFAATPFYVNAQRRDWPRGSAPRRAGVSAFGIGGTNVHLVLEEAPQPPPRAAAAPVAQLLLVSARTETALDATRGNLAAHLGAHPEQALGDVAGSLQLGRRSFLQRAFVIARDGAEAAARLGAALPAAQRGRARAEAGGVAFMFPGQGAQYPDMARDLYDAYPLFRRHFDRCAELCAPHLGQDLRALVYPPEKSADAAARLTATAVAQPAIFAVEYALAQLWIGLGVEPRAMVGHSIGEFVAAVLAGVMTLEDALPIVVLRGRLMQELPAGAMLAVRLPEAELRALLPQGCAIAAINAPSLSVASGPEAAIATLEQALKARSLISRRLQTSHAFHSAMVDPIVEPLERRMGQVALAPPKYPYVSCVTGTWISEAEATSPRYWARHARETVRFADALTTLTGSERAPVLLEVGPGNVLSTLALQGLRGRDVPVVTSLQDAARESSDHERLLEALGRLWVQGVEPDWAALHATPPRRVPLPAYPFERKRFWVEAPASARTPRAPPAAAEGAAAPAPEPAAPAATPGGRVAEIAAAIGAILEQLSGNAPASTSSDRTFLEMGYDSLFLTQVAQKIQGQMKVKLTFRQLLGDYPTIPALAGFLAQRAPGAPAAAAAPAAVPAAPAPSPSRYAVFAPTQAGSAHGLTAAQRSHIDDLVARYTRRTAGSKRLTQQHRQVLADPRAASGFRSEWKELVYPIVVERSAGSKLWDVDGNEYVDLVNGFGGTAFGHGPEFVVDAVRAQLERGFPIGPQADLAGEVAELIKELTGNERATFCNTGSEAVMAAMRVARTVTGRDKIVIFNGDYHGQFDEVLVKGVQHPGAAPRSVPVAPGIPPSAVQNMIVLDYATPATLQWVREHAEELAAVVVEPVQSRHPSLQPFEFLREIRQITATAGTAFVLDEVVTGFRAHAGGIQALAGVRADLVTYGKVVGGGLPIGILAGSAKFMDALDGGDWRFGDASVPEVGVTFFAGTFVRHPLVLAAARSVLLHLKRAGPQLQQSLEQRTAALSAELNALFTAHHIATRVETYSSWFYFNIHNEHSLAPLLFYHLRLRGIHIQDGFPCFLTTAHSDADVRRIYEAFRDSVAELSAAGILGRAPTPESEAAAAAAPERAAASADGPIPLTESQTEIWLAAQMADEASCAFNESVSLDLRGTLDAATLREALALLFARHDALRARFTVTGEAMHIAAPQPVELPLADVSGERDPSAALARLIDADARIAFDLVSGPVARVQLVRLEAAHHVLIFTAHHIVCDGWSINIIVTELTRIYASLRAGAAPALPPALQFSAYARAQAQGDPAANAATESYWLGRFREPVRPLELPSDRPRPPLRSYSGASRCRRIDAALYRAIKQGGARSGITLFVTLLGAFQALIGRLCDQTEVVVGVPTAGQSLLDEDILVGHCVNFLPIRTQWQEATSVGEHLRSVAQQVLDASEHSNYTLGTLVRKLALARETNRMPLTEIQFNLERLAARLELAGLAVEVAPNSKAHVVFDLFLNVIESDEGLRLDCDYNTDLFDAATVDLWLECYQRLLEQLFADPALPVIRLEYLPAAERARVLSGFNDTAAGFPAERCIHELVAARAATRPQAVAVQFGEQTLTYAELERHANRLAALLLARLGTGAAPGRRVAVAVDRSAEMLVALLAVLKAGCAYVPLEPSHPAARLRHILTDAAAAALISDGSVDAGVLPGGLPVIELRAAAAALAAADAPASPAAVGAGDLAYLMYTSGSTGKPKGVEVTHRSVVNFLSSMAREPGMSERDVLLAVTTVSFDIAALELFLPLTVGARVVIATREQLADGFALRQQLERSHATLMQATPATWRLLLEAGFRAAPGFRMLCGGEALPGELAERLLEGEGALWNMYGPTETTIWSACGRVQRGTAVSVGRPIGNTQLYVLDRHDQPLPTGVPGQLLIGGEGVARGYHNQPQLTAERFPANPFAPGRMYRSGDLARWLPDGQLQVLGRTDEQVKLRGFRIELGEIEQALLRVPGVAAAAVMLRADGGNARLVGYYVQSAGHAHAPAALRAALETQIPDYMVPTAWVPLERLPLSAHGKLDRAALPRPELGGGDAEEFVAPRTPTEICLAAIWAEVLHLPRVSANMDLLRLGADSIQLFQIIARSTREGFHLTARQLLQQRTLSAVAALADAAGGATAGAGRAPLPTLGQFERSRRSASTTKR